MLTPKCLFLFGPFRLDGDLLNGSLSNTMEAPCVEEVVELSHAAPSEQMDGSTARRRTTRLRSLLLSAVAQRTGNVTPKEITGGPTKIGGGE